MEIFLYLLAIVLMSPNGEAQESAEKDVSYYVYTKQLKDTHLLYNETSIQFDRNAIVVFIIHGWSETHTTKWYPELTDAYLSRTDATYNVVQVDWSKPAGVYYLKAVANVKPVGESIGEYIHKIVKQSKTSLGNIHIVGHSLGGQVAGFLAKTVQKLSGRKLPRITGLDPAGPLFYLRPTDQRLNPNDADVVLVIHTDAIVFGFAFDCGTADVFPNGGHPIQPGCPNPFSDLFCSHHRSYEFYIEAVKYRKMIATKCSSYSSYTSGSCKNGQTINLGGTITPEDRGDYYLTTNSKPPYTKSP